MIKNILVTFIILFLGVTSYFTYLYFILNNEKKVIEIEKIINYTKEKTYIKKDQEIVNKEVKSLPLFIKTDFEKFGIDTSNITEKDWHNYLSSIQKSSINLISKYNEHGYSLFHYAAEYSDFRLLKYLMKQGLDVNKKDNYGETALSKAVRNSNIEVVKFLLNNSNNLDITAKYDNNTYDLLELALYNNDEKERDKIISLLKERGFAFNDIKYFDDLNSLRNEKYLLELLPKIDINHKVNDSASIFDFAILKDQGDEIINYFLNNEAEVNKNTLNALIRNKNISKENTQKIVNKVFEKEGELSFSILSAAITSYNFIVVEAMLKGGADLNGVDSFGRNAYDFINPPNKFIKEQSKKNKEKMKKLLDTYNQEI